MSIVRNILVALICGSPVILPWDGLTAQGLVAGIAAIAVVIAAVTLRPGETGFLISVIRLPLVLATVPALWVLLQVLPLRVLSHPIWRSAETGLQHPLAGGISVDPGASIIALGHYLTVAAVAFLSAAIAVDRQRAAWILFALSGAVTIIAVMLMASDLLYAGAGLAAFARTQAIDCVGLGTIIAGAACMRAIERTETRNVQQQSLPQSLIFSSAALAICGAALMFGAKQETIFATACGLFALAYLAIIRRLRLRLLGIAGMAVPAIGIAVALVSTHQAQSGVSVPLAFAAESPALLTALSQRMFDDAPLVGTGAGTFAALAPIYREMNDPPPGSTAPTAAGAFAIELGQPMFWLITAATVGLILMLLRASLQRGRDSYYSAMGGSCLITLLLLGFTNAGLFGTVASLIAAAAVGLGLAQSQSRKVQL